MNPAAPSRHVRLFRNGRSQAIRIPREFEFSGAEVVVRKEGTALIIEPVQAVPLAALLAGWAPLGEDFPAIDDLPPEPVEL
ncbi:antitoxin [Chitinasiproducens palmae]|uniref:Antitoxin VapB n=1 Tax=Chitinasiproducens palmae TaxID=1770053 RepID=A0A1H2PQA0_9BURK|nr:AbrB/MazE/SpoVT family DNA-binding domain-containing protein [Chitinasiproducens palmae]SDV48551.1 antitoxin VapB [Chitinasiproducens palmae]